MSRDMLRSGKSPRSPLAVDDAPDGVDMSDNTLSDASQKISLWLAQTRFPRPRPPLHSIPNPPANAVSSSGHAPVRNGGLSKQKRLDCDCTMSQTPTKKRIVAGPDKT